ncbi:MAG: DUF5780 domain-containing protein [Dethiobacteria bacterium]
MKKYSLLLIVLLIVGCTSLELTNPESETTDEALQETIAKLEQENKELKSKLELLKPEDEREEHRIEPSAERERLDLVCVESVRIVVQDEKHKALYPDMIEVVIRNNSKETIKNYKVGMLGFDNNGYPVKIEWQLDFSGGSYEKIGLADDANVLPGETFGKNKGWELFYPHNLRYVLACVYEAIFYDDTVWKNPDYNNWRNKFIEEPLPEEYRK